MCCENHIQTVNFEGRVTSVIGKTQILPAALRYQAEVATAVNASKAAGADNAAQLELLKSLTAMITDFQKALSQLEHELGHHAEGEVLAHAKHFRDKVLPAMAEVRKFGDQLEGIGGDDPWPLPTYAQLRIITHATT